MSNWITKKTSLTLREALDELRHGLGLNVSDFAEKFGIARPTLYRYERSKEENGIRPSPASLIKFVVAALDSGAPPIVVKPFIERLAEDLGISHFAAFSTAALASSDGDDMKAVAKLLRPASEILGAR